MFATKPDEDEQEGDSDESVDDASEVDDSVEDDDTGSDNRSIEYAERWQFNDYTIRPRNYAQRRVKFIDEERMSSGNNSGIHSSTDNVNNSGIHSSTDNVNNSGIRYPWRRNRSGSDSEDESSDSSLENHDPSTNNCRCFCIKGSKM